MAHHLLLGTIVDHVINAEPLGAAAVEHIESCARCRTDLSWLEALRNAHRPEPPKSSVETVSLAIQEETGHGFNT